LCSEALARRRGHGASGKEKMMFNVNELEAVDHPGGRGATLLADEVYLRPEVMP
jgi:hypothetical protein